MAPQYPVLPETLLIISLKMFFTPERTLEYLHDLLEPENEIVCTSNRDKVLLALIPDFLTIYPCADIIRQRFPSEASLENGSRPPPFLLGAQDCFWQDEGAYTGEISPKHLRQLGVSIVELGHAERRAIFKETDEMTGRKAAAASRHGMVPLVCIGEVNGPGPASLAVQECETQVRAVLEAIDEEAPVIFAYEPVWAIGKPRPASVEHVAAVVQGVRDVIGERKGSTRVIYGGSAGPGLWSEGGLGKAVDGMFLGRFGHEVDGVRKVVREIESAAPQYL
ncbi:hypothetical protein KEM55_004947 [Ascosphaera atra]|nr:hypothetical protein KEM55_004947 [Ascosphaera atra]